MPANKHTTQTAIDIAPQKLSEREDQFYNKFDGVYPNINTDPETCKATEIKILSAARPHMRGFHSSWISFFLAFFCWFAIAPLLSTLRLPEEEGGLGISKQDIWTSSIVSVCGTIVMRIVLGPMCDKVSEVSSFSVSATTKLKIIINSVWPTYHDGNCSPCRCHSHRPHWPCQQRHWSHHCPSLHWSHWILLCHVSVLDYDNVHQGGRWNC